jgi:hypothetical protein
MAIDIEAVTPNQADNALLKGFFCEIQDVVVRLEARSVFEVFAADEGVREVQRRWEDAVDDNDRLINPNWEEIARESAEAAVRSVLGALVVLSRETAVDAPPNVT